MGCKAVHSLQQAGFADTNWQELACAALQLHCVLIASQQRTVNILQAQRLVRGCRASWGPGCASAGAGIKLSTSMKDAAEHSEVPRTSHSGPDVKLAAYTTCWHSVCTHYLMIVLCRLLRKQIQAKHSL